MFPALFCLLHVLQSPNRVRHRSSVSPMGTPSVHCLQKTTAGGVILIELRCKVGHRPAHVQVLILLLSVLITIHTTHCLGNAWASSASGK